MRNRSFAVAAVLVLSIVAAAGLAYAQQTLLVANVPFEFVAGGQTLPAGEYRIEPATTSGPQLLLIKRTDGHALRIVSTMAVLASEWPSQARLVFECYGNQCFLSQIWTLGTKYGRELPMSSREKELASKETRREVVLLARASTR